MSPVPIGSGHQITCTFTDLLRFRTIAELPVDSLQFSKVLNGVGSWSGSLNVEDLGMRRADWLGATEVNKTGIWVDIDKRLLYGGINQGRVYRMSEGKLDLTGNDFCFYLAQRIQAKDYDEYTDPEGREWHWPEGGPFPKGEQAPLRIAYYVLSQALAKEHSIPIKVVADGETPRGSFITFSAPATQQQTLASILSSIQSLGITVGIDYALDVAFDGAGRPTATITLSYPRRGGGPRKQAPIIDLSEALDLEYPEDGTSQANSIVELAGATTARAATETWPPTFGEGYPLFEVVVSHSSLAPSGEDAFVLAALAAGDLSLMAYPTTTPVVTLPLFGPLSIDEIEVGDDIWLFVPVVAGTAVNNNPRFPGGLRFLFRLVRIDVEVPNEGVARMKLTLNTLPEIDPVRPPVATSEAESEEWIKKEEERSEKEEEEKEEKLLTEGTFVVDFKLIEEGEGEKFFEVVEGIEVIEGESVTEVLDETGSYKVTIASVTPAIPEGVKKIVIEKTAGEADMVAKAPPTVAADTGKNIEIRKETIPFPPFPASGTWHFKAYG